MRTLALKELGSYTNFTFHFHMHGNPLVLPADSCSCKGQLAHISLVSYLWGIGIQYMQNAASHLGLVCLHREISSKNEIEIKKSPLTKVDSPE